MTAVVQKTVLTGCLAPIDKNGLEQLIANGKANPKVVKTLKCKTVAEGKFRHANYIRNLPPYIVDEPPGLLGDDTAPNPSEASLAALGSCLAVGLHANAVHRGWIVNKLELELEGDLNITAVWGTGDVSDKPVGFTDVRVKVDMECEGDRAGRDQRAGRRTSRSGRRWPTPSRGRSISRSSDVTARQGCGGSHGRRWRHLGRRSTQAADRRHRSPIRWRRWRARTCAPLAAAIDEGTVYPAELLHRARRCRRLGQPRAARAAQADLRCAIKAIAAIGEVCGATAFMAWCQNTLVWYAANSDNPKLAARLRRRLRNRQDPRRHRPVQPDEELLRHRELEAEGAQGRRRLRRARRAALGVQSRPGPLFRHDLRARGSARRDRDVPRRLLRSRDHACSHASRFSPWTAPAPTACSSATPSCRTT